MLQITGKTCLTGLLGSPVAHSISPLMHNFSFGKLGINWVYLCFDVKEDGLKEAVQGLRALQVKGFNLTMPNKNKILEYLDELSPAARLIGAVNTVENRDGRLIGHNTDGVGFMQSVREQGIRMEGETMTLLGMGGAATAICAQAALDQVGTIHVFARSGSRHRLRMEGLQKALAKETACTIEFHDLEEPRELREALAKSRLLVNATSVGMAPDTEKCLIPDNSFLYEELAVADIIYNPWKTKLLCMAEQAGCKAFNGYSMLIWQGAEAFRIWTGQEMPVDQVRTYLKRQ